MYSPNTRAGSTGSRAAAWGVHLYTALGAPIALAAIEATARGRYATALWWMALALFIDSTDGTLARRFHVKRVIPEFDGSKLDDIIDYLNYAVVPAFLAYHAGLLSRGVFGLAVASLPLLASSYGFCQAVAKTADHFFTGFPSYWNVVVFYLYILGFPVWLNAAILICFSIAVFVPVRYLYPSRNPKAQRTTYVLGVIWTGAALTLLWQLPSPSPALALASLLFPLYYFMLSLWLHRRTPVHPSHSSESAPSGDGR